ncbi:hypothetical protein EYC80_008089 [Monilinia laxa]|uniref:Uncharacterized protein n=1 Tax=Monilinia laxa TaxID=61186 RepID=A0A5N6JTE6_MONLA|nr:hypothetical protein EYC80_008089 [Monilinia laxa]
MIGKPRGLKQLLRGIPPTIPRNPYACNQKRLDCIAMCYVSTPKHRLRLCVMVSMTRSRFAWLECSNIWVIVARTPRESPEVKCM